MTTGRKQVTETQRLSTGGLKPLADLVDHLDLTSHFVGDAVLNGADPVIRSPHHIGEAAAMANWLIGVAGAAIWKARTGQQTYIPIDVIVSVDCLQLTHYICQQGG